MTEPSRLEVRELGLWLEQRVVLDDVSLTLEPGEVCALLGPNGSGKTSLFRCIAGLWRPGHGHIWLDGEPLDKGTRAPRAHMGVVFQEPSLDDTLTVRENLELAAALFGIRGSEARARVEDLLGFVELGDRRRDPGEDPLGGMRRRLDLARALIHSPSLLLLDEPTTGLDLRAHERFWRRLLALKSSGGMAILVTTHRADEAERCDRVIVMDRGRIVESATPAHLLERVAGDVLTIDAEEPEQLAADILEHLELPAQCIGGQVVLQRERGHELVPRLVEAVGAARIHAIGVHRPTLADAFLEITGRSLDTEVDAP